MLLLLSFVHMISCCFFSSWFSTDHYDPDYEFLQQDLSDADQIPQQVPSALSPLPESLGESGSPFHGQTFQLLENCSPSLMTQMADVPPALPEKKRKGTSAHVFDTSSCKILFERHLSQYDNISEDDMHTPALFPSMPFTPFATVLPFQPGTSRAPVEFLADFAAPDSTGDSEKPPPLPEKKSKHSRPRCCFYVSFSHGTCMHLVLIVAAFTFLTKCSHHPCPRTVGHQRMIPSPNCECQLAH